MDPPTKPDDAECCGSGCTPCIFDIYEEQLKNHKRNEPQTNTGINCISLTTYTLFEIVQIEQDSHNTFLYTFKYLRKNKRDRIDSDKKHQHQLFYNPGQHFLLRGEDEKSENQNRFFTRAYTPITIKQKQTDCFTILMKFYEHGVMSNYLRKLPLNAETYWRGPYGTYTINYKLKKVLMICQGTGIAPLFSIINSYVANENCETFIKLFYCCTSVETIHLRNEIHKLSSYWNFTYEVFLRGNHPHEHLNRKYNETINCRRLGENDLTRYFDGNKSQSEILICGNETFTRNFVDLLTNKNNVAEELIHVF